jgi:hypothetical protein
VAQQCWFRSACYLLQCRSACLRTLADLAKRTVRMVSSDAMQSANSPQLRADAGKRALNVWLRNNANGAIQQDLARACVALHAPTRTGDYHFSRAELQDAVRHNFETARRWLDEAPEEHRSLVQVALADRCASPPWCCCCGASTQRVHFRSDARRGCAVAQMTKLTRARACQSI